MGQKDVTEKILEAYNDVFADIVNVLLFNGREVILPDELEEQAPRSYYKADGKTREIERDVAKRWKKENIRIACLGLENQTEADEDMPLRVFAYDGAEYRAQLQGDKREIHRYPVVTLVLYFGDKHWNKPKSLFERLEIPEEFKPFVQDYKIHLFEIAYLSQKQVKMFKSDFRIVADYFVQKRASKDYKPSSAEFEHVQETLQLLSVMAGDHRFEDVCNDCKEREVRNMCEVLDRVEQRGIEQGIEQGIEKGELKAKRETAFNMKKKNYSDNVIAELLDVGVNVVQSWFSEMPTVAR